MVERLEALRRSDMGRLQSLLPAPTAAVSARLVEPLRVVSLRYLPGSERAIEKTLAAVGLSRFAQAGRFEGTEPMLLWRSPSEMLFISSSDRAADDLLRALPVDDDPLACALDQSAGSCVIELQGEGVDAVLQRLLDASAIPQQPGQGTRARLADIAVGVWRLEAQRVGLLFDRSHDTYVAQWLAYAVQGAVQDS